MSPTQMPEDQLRDSDEQDSGTKTHPGELTSRRNHPLLNAARKVSLWNHFLVEINMSPAWDYR